MKTIIYNYLNVKNKLRDMTNEEFNIFVKEFSKQLFFYGFDQLLKDYNKKLKSVINDWNKLKTQQIDTDFINSTNTVGLSIIKRYMVHIYSVENFKGKSIKNLWTIPNIEKALRYNRQSHPTPYVSEIIRQIGFGAGTSKVTIFRPLLSKRIVQYFNAKEVLDPCIGWGGRMLGSKCIDGVNYTGCEPAPLTYKSLVKIKRRLKLTKTKLYNERAELIIPKLKQKYDLILTSPPYYNLEIYSDIDKQYTSYEQWLTVFLKPVVYGSLAKLIDGGVSCWSVKNFKTDQKYNLYDDIVRLHQDKGWYKKNIEFYVGNCIRPGSKKTDKGNKSKGKEVTYAFMKD